MPVLGSMRALVLGSVVAIAVAGAACLLIAEKRLLIDPLLPLATCFAVYLVTAFMNYWQEERSKQSVCNASTRYLVPAIVEQLSFREETRELTILCSDVRSFTGTSKSYRDDPKWLSAARSRRWTLLHTAGSRSARPSGYTELRRLGPRSPAQPRSAR